MSEKDITSPSFIGHYKMKDVSICDDLINFHKKDPLKLKSEGAVGVGSSFGDIKVCTKSKKSTDICLSTKNSHISKFCPSFYKYLEELEAALEAYKKEYIYADKVAKYAICERLNIQHYKAGEGYFEWHKERNGASNRHLVFMTYLNDVPDGGTEFYYQNYTSKAIKGNTLIWPTDWTHTHRGQITDIHEKYIITGWYSYI